MREFSEAWQIFRSDVVSAKAMPGPLLGAPRPHRLDESATGYSLVSCSPAEPTSASPAFVMVGQAAQGCQVLPSRGGDFSTGEMGSFHPALTVSSNERFTSRERPPALGPSGHSRPRVSRLKARRSNRRGEQPTSCAQAKAADMVFRAKLGGWSSRPVKGGW
jgi:hypothetical protein